MNRLVAFLSVWLAASFSLFAAETTTVRWNLRNFTGVNLNRSVLVTLVSGQNPMADGTNIVGGVLWHVQPVNGVALQPLRPGNYTWSIDGLKGSFGMNVFLTNVTMDATSLTTNLPTVVVSVPTVVSSITAGSTNVHVSPANGVGAVTVSVVGLGSAAFISTNDVAQIAAGAVSSIDTNTLSSVAFRVSQSITNPIYAAVDYDPTEYELIWFGEYYARPVPDDPDITLRYGDSGVDDGMWHLSYSGGSGDTTNSTLAGAYVQDQGGELVQICSVRVASNTVAKSAELLCLATNTPVEPPSGYGYLWPSNYTLIWVTPAGTNTLATGQDVKAATNNLNTQVAAQYATKASLDAATNTIQEQLPLTSGPVPILWDDDGPWDSDNIISLAMAFTMQDQGLIDIQCMVNDYPRGWATNDPAIWQAFCNYYGYPHIVQGMVDYPNNSLDWTSPNGTGNYPWAWHLPVWTTISNFYPYTLTTTNQVLSGLDAYRKTLSQATRPVTIIMGGPVKGMYDLWHSGADKWSALTGRELLAKSCKEIIVMSGNGPANQYNKLTFTITNTPSAGATLTINGTTRTWRSSVTTPATEVLIGANKDTCTTNLYNHLASYPISTLNLYSSGYVASNALHMTTRPASSITFTPSAGWATPTLGQEIGNYQYVWPQSVLDNFGLNDSMSAWVFTNSFPCMVTYISPQLFGFMPGNMISGTGDGLTNRPATDIIRAVLEPWNAPGSGSPTGDGTSKPHGAALNNFCLLWAVYGTNSVWGTNRVLLPTPGHITLGYTPGYYNSYSGITNGWGNIAYDQQYLTVTQPENFYRTNFEAYYATPSKRAELGGANKSGFSVVGGLALSQSATSRAELFVSNNVIYARSATKTNLVVDLR